MQIKYFTANNSTKTFASLPLLISLLGGMTLFPNIVSAEDAEYQVQSGDSLSRIIAKNYPEVSRKSYDIIMQHVLENNPSAFANKNMNSLRLGKTLILADKEKIEGLKPAPPKPVPVNPEEFKKLQSQNSALEEQLQALKSKLDGVGSSSSSSSPAAQDSSDTTASTENTGETNTQNQEQLSTLQAKIDELNTLTEKLTSEKTAQEARLSEAQAQSEQLQTRITELTEQKTEQAEATTSESDERLAALQAEIDTLKAQLAEAENGKNAEQTDTSNALEAANKQLDTAKAEAEKLRATIGKYEAEQQDNSAAAAETTKQVETLRASVKQYEAEKESNATTTDTTAKQNEDLTAELEQLHALVDKYESEQKDAPKTASGEGGDQQLEDLQFQIDQLQALVTKYEEELDATADSTGTPITGSESTGSADGNNSELEKENSLLKAELEKARNKANADNQTISNLQSSGAANNTVQPAVSSNTGTGTSTTPPAKKPASWLTLSTLSWLLPLLAILIGLYLLLGLLKRKRDREATQNLKIAMSSSAATSTADAFGVDGSLLPSTTATDGNPIKVSSDDEATTVEEDSVEAGVKINMAKAYLELGDTAAANDVLQEVAIEGSTAQKETAKKLQA